MKHNWRCDVCQRCGLQRHGYSGGRTGRLFYRTRSGRVLAALPRCPGAPATEGSAGGAERLGKITSNVSVPTHAEGGDHE